MSTNRDMLVTLLYARQVQYIVVFHTMERMIRETLGQDDYAFWFMRAQWTRELIQANADAIQSLTRGVSL